MSIKKFGLFALIIIILSLLAVSVLAQETVTYDDVIRVAERMYCPICENEPLDECRNQTCLNWKDEIFRRLQNGESDDEIIDYFVETYGQHVTGVPQDPLLRLLSFIAPILGTVLALVIGWMTFRRWQKNTPMKTQLDDSSSTQSSDDDYRARLERDLAG